MGNHDPWDEYDEPAPRQMKSDRRSAQQSDAIETLLRGEIAKWNRLRSSDPKWKPDLRNLDFSDCELEGVDLKRTILNGSSFVRANLRRARLDGAKLRGVVFDEANLTDANLAETHVQDATFVKTVLNGTDLRGARGIDDGQIHAAKATARIKRDSPRIVAKRIAAPSIFLSYSSEDKKSVDVVDQWLRHKYARVILDDRDFFAGETIRSEILRCIEGAGVIVCFISENSKDRPYPRLEREIADTYHDRGEKQVIYFTLDETVLGIDQEVHLYVPAHTLEFDEACARLWRGITRSVGTPKEIDLSGVRAAGSDWTRETPAPASH